MAETIHNKNRNAAYSALFLALLVFIVRILGYLFTWPLFQWQTYFVFAHIFFVLLLVLIAEKPWVPVLSFIENAKSGVRAAAIYSFAVTALSAIYYGLINTAYFAGARHRIIAQELNANPGENAEKLRDGVNQVFTLGHYLLITLVGLIVAGILYALLMALLMKLFKKAGRAA